MGLHVASHNSLAPALLAEPALDWASALPLPLPACLPDPTTAAQPRMQDAAPEQPSRVTRLTRGGHVAQQSVGEGAAVDLGDDLAGRVLDVGW